MAPNDNPPVEDVNETHDNVTQPQSAPTEDDQMRERIDRLGGEAAPDISPEEFARLQRTGSLHIDSHGRIRPIPRRKWSASSQVSPASSRAMRNTCS